MARLRQMPNGLMPNFTQGFSGLDALGHRAHERVDVVAPPVGDVVEARAVRGVGRGIRNRLPGHRVRVEVVVEVHAVEVVVLDRVQDGPLDVLLRLGQARVEVELAAVRPDPLGVHARRVLGHELGGVGLHRDAVGVEPGVQLEVAAVRLVDDERERVVARGPGPARR